MRINKDKEQKGYADGLQFANLTTQTVLTLARVAFQKLDDASYIKGLANGSRLPARNLALAMMARDYSDIFQDDAEVVDMLKAAHTMSVKDIAKREKLFRMWRDDSSVTYEDVKRMAREMNSKPQRAKRTSKTQGDELTCENCTWDGSQDIHSNCGWCIRNKASVKDYFKPIDAAMSADQ